MFRLVILDVDGTLMDSNYLHVEAWARAFQDHEIQIPRSVIHKQIGNCVDLMLEELLNRSLTNYQALKESYSQYYQAIQEYGRPLPGAKELLSHLSSQPIAVWVATSAKSEELEYHLTQLKARDKIDGIVSSEDVDRAKPTPHIFQQILERASASAEECIVVGDTIWDIRAAVDCGIKILTVMTGGAYSRRELEDEGAEAIFQDCSELLLSLPSYD